MGGVEVKRDYDYIRELLFEIEGDPSHIFWLHSRLVRVKKLRKSIIMRNCCAMRVSFPKLTTEAFID